MPAHDAARFANVAAARRDHDPDLIDRIVDATFDGDPAADALVERFRTMPGGAGWRALEQGDTSIPEVAALLVQPPDWIDFDLVDAGAVALWRAGAPALLLALTCGSLAFGYQSAALARPLAATGRLERMAPRRLGETSDWYLTAVRPGAMHPGAVGYDATVRLRVVHALVRSHLLRSPKWDRDAWGVPISAADGMAVAIGGFHIIPMRALVDLGVRFSAADREAMTQLWAWIALVMGVPGELLPRSYAQAREMIEAAMAVDSGPSEDSVKLLKALLEHGFSGAPLMRLPASLGLPESLNWPARKATSFFLAGLARRWMGDDMADRLEVPRTPLTHAAPLLRPLSLARDLVRLSRVLGDDARFVERELAFSDRLRAIGRPPRTIAPHQMAAEPVLGEAAA